MISIFYFNNTNTKDYYINNVCMWIDDVKYSPVPNNTFIGADVLAPTSLTDNTIYD